MQKTLCFINQGVVRLLCGACLLFSLSCNEGPANEAVSQAPESVDEVMNGVVSRLQAQFTMEELDALDEAAIRDFLKPAEEEVLATKYWEFTVNQPVRLSLMRDTSQAVPPFWLADAGFVKTDLLVHNSIATYEVWQKDFPAGKVALGINGFDRHRPVYFISIAPLEGNEDLRLDAIFPKHQHLDVLRPGAFTYTDMRDLLLDSVPSELQGQVLIRTYRGRSREAHLVGGFRETAYPSSDRPDQIVLTLSGDPATSMTIQWRSASSVEEGEVRYWKENSTDTLSQPADQALLEDRLLYHDRYIQRFTAQLEGLEPGQRYGYVVQDAHGTTSKTAYFRTAHVPAGQRSNEGFEFIWGGDTHNDSSWVPVVNYMAKHLPSAAFYVHSGDLVNTGLYRNDWDLFFHYSNPLFTHIPLMAVPGNHDSQDGLGAGMFRSLLRYPSNGPAEFPDGMTYAFRYENALFLMMDAIGIPAAAQVDWLEEQLSQTPQADWKFLVVHFPPYNEVQDFPAITEHWVPVLEKHGVDVVMSGHFHYYMRTEPLLEGKPHPDGVSYLMSLAMNASREAKNKKSFVALRHELQGNLFQRFQIKGNTLNYQAYDMEGKVLDSFSMKKDFR